MHTVLKLCTSIDSLLNENMFYFTYTICYLLFYVLFHTELHGNVKLHCVLLLGISAIRWVEPWLPFFSEIFCGSYCYSRIYTEVGCFADVSPVVISFLTAACDSTRPIRFLIDLQPS